jgi:hypothetical protein
MFPDISEHNGTVDWDALDAAYHRGQIEAVAMRAGFGTVRADLQFARNQQECRSRGIPAIYYWFCYPAYNSPAAEATMFNATIGPLRPTEAMVGDFEDDPQARPFPRGQAGLDWARQFLTALQSPHNATWWYTYPSLLTEVGLQPLLQTWPFWEADYSTRPDSAFAPAIARQFTDCGSTPGVSGCCDQSRVLRPPLSQWLAPPAGVSELGGDSMAWSFRPGQFPRADLAYVGTDGVYYWLTSTTGPLDVPAYHQVALPPPPGGGQWAWGGGSGSWDQQGLTFNLMAIMPNWSAFIGAGHPDQTFDGWQPVPNLAIPVAPVTPGPPGPPGPVGSHTHPVSVSGNTGQPT